MGDVINLNQYRKQHVRAAGRKTAAANRHEHGRDKASRVAEYRERVRRDRELAGKHLDDAAEDDGPPSAG